MNIKKIHFILLLSAWISPLQDEAIFIEAYEP